MSDYLDDVYKECVAGDSDRTEGSIPRILLIGPNLSDGDYNILEVVKNAGAEIVIEEICEGFRYYWQNIGVKGDVLRSLAKGYLQDKLPCAFMRFSSKKRLDFTLELIKDFNISGVVWYQLLCCETYDLESFFFARELGERNIPMLILESAYEAEGIGQVKIRVDAFIEMLKGGIE
jgi:benzoyl-CoA reductase/2-hydroxyglutaryl-CoA dehydratase subunit BcrC/BadD/HgdB